MTSTPSGKTMGWLLCGAMAWALATATLAAGSSAGPAARNLDFEQGQPGALPPGWSAAGAQVGGFTATMSRAQPHGGQACLEIRRDTGGKWPLCFVRQAIDATPYRGRRVRLSGWLRFQPSDSEQEFTSSSSARIWMRSGGHPWFYDDLGDHPVRSAEWTFAEVRCEVASDADSIVLGATLSMYGRAWFDDLKLDVLGGNGEGDEPARALDERGVENLCAFGRLLGYVRHFHPSDEAAAVDWDSFAIAGAGEVESATTPEELKSRLERLFLSIAPTLRLATKPLPPLTAAALRRSGVAPERITGWQHRGWAGRYPWFYSQRRVVAPAEAPGDSLLPIGSEVNAELGGGVWCSVPHTLYVGADGTVPRGLGGASRPRRPNSWVPTGNDRATRIAGVLLFWNVMQHFYPYFDETGTDWPSELPAALHAAATDPDGASFDVTLHRLSAALRDGHAFVSSPYWNPDIPPWPFAWSFVEDRLVLVRVDSTRVGDARVGDEVVAIQERPTTQWVKEAQALESGATPQRIRVRVARVLQTMAARDTLVLDLRSPEGAARHIRVTPHATAKLTPARPDSVQEVAPGVIYLDMNRITDADFLTALPKINAGKGVIFDLRGYPYRIFGAVIAHLADSTVASPRWGFPVVLRPDHRDTTFAWQAYPVEPESLRVRVHAAFLIDGNAISAAETLLGIVESYKLADLVGEPTAGTNGNINSVLLPGQYSVTFTGMKVLKHNGSRHHGVGILPTVPVSPTIAGIAAGRDEQLERAIEVVRGE